MGWDARRDKSKPTGPLAGERIAIVGTAQSWKLAPWTDTGLKIWSLNDAYRLKGFVRADAWFDFHPLDKFHYPEDGQKSIYAHTIPNGHYVRPKGHLEWLAKQIIPTYLHPDYQAQHAAASDWPMARPFPRAAVEAYFGRYFTSSPALMMAYAIMQGAREIHVYGIHLATEHEYIEQRPNFEFLIGRVLGAGQTTETVKDGLRRYETEHGVIVLPEASPVLQSDFRYAAEARPRHALEPLKWEMHKIQVKRERAIEQLRTRKWWQSSSAAQQELSRLAILQADTQDALSRVQAAQQWV